VDVSDGGRARLAGPWIAVAAPLGMLLLLWAATAGPPRFFEPGVRRGTHTVRTETPTASPSDQTPPMRDLTRDLERTRDLSWIGELLAWAVLLALVVAVVLLLRAVWQRRWRRPEPTPVMDADVLPVAEVARTIAEDADAHLDAISGGTPRNAIVRCWLALEDSVAAAGIERRRHETSTEFTVRVLHHLDLDPGAVGALAALYREARFSEHQLGEDARAAAGTALRRIHEDLGRVGAAR
jgi:hypothetical protein